MFNIEIHNLLTNNDLYSLPADEDLIRWAQRVFLKFSINNADLAIVIVNDEEMQKYNKQYRNKDKTTNVLSFSSDEDMLALNIFGDIILSAPTIIKEANEQQKTVKAHFAHMIVHGVLHLLGHDHIKQEDFLVMKKLEIELLADLKFSNPYL